MDEQLQQEQQTENIAVETAIPSATPLPPPEKEYHVYFAGYGSEDQAHIAWCARDQAVGTVKQYRKVVVAGGAFAETVFRLDRHPHGYLKVLASQYIESGDTLILASSEYVQLPPGTAEGQ